MNDSEYIIIGDTETYDGCLVLACGKSEEHAEKILSRMLTNPTQSDKYLVQGHKNLRIKEVEKSGCWWSKGCD